MVALMDSLGLLKRASLRPHCAMESDDTTVNSSGGGSGSHVRVRADGAVDGTDHDGCHATVAAR